MKKLIRAGSDIEAGMIKGILEDEGIVCMTNTRGGGVMYGGQLCGVDVYVSEEDAKRADELLTLYFESKEDGEFVYPDNAFSDDGDDEVDISSNDKSDEDGDLL